ncbi:hypothetical protein TRIUR3_17984 [Triticum urartu]|uniref:Uncharacterized protein n=1 Tax=Triticum urartu TaxID=4572 RepID=M7ZNC4_TRIUA|nr:hypothetical protein TRIUR3_17984 [Triticum urartu]
MDACGSAFLHLHTPPAHAINRSCCLQAALPVHHELNPPADPSALLPLLALSSPGNQGGQECLLRQVPTPARLHGHSFHYSSETSRSTMFCCPVRNRQVPEDHKDTKYQDDEDLQVRLPPSPKSSSTTMRCATISTMKREQLPSLKAVK